MATRMATRSYSELITIPSFEDRFRYLVLQGQVGEATFGWDRWINQQFYRSKQWRDVRREVIIRDNGCELSHEEFPIGGRIYIHHMNPMSVQDITHADESILDPEFLISCSLKVHNSIHYGDESLLPRSFVPRSSNDTIPWRNHNG